MRNHFQLQERWNLQEIWGSFTAFFASKWVRVYELIDAEEQGRPSEESEMIWGEISKGERVLRTYYE